MFQEGNSGTVCRMYKRQPSVNSEAAVRSFELQCRGKVLASIMNNRGLRPKEGFECSTEGLENLMIRSLVSEAHFGFKAY